MIGEKETFKRMTYLLIREVLRKHSFASELREEVTEKLSQVFTESFGYEDPQVEALAEAYATVFYSED